MKKVSIIPKVQAQMLKGATYNILIEVTGLTLIITTEGKHHSGCNGEKKTVRTQRSGVTCANASYTCYRFL